MKFGLVLWSLAVLVLPACSSGGAFGVCDPDGGECPTSDGSTEDDGADDARVVRDSAAGDTRVPGDTAVERDSTPADTAPADTAPADTGPATCVGNACGTAATCCGSAQYCTGASTKRCTATRGASGYFCGATADCESGLTCVSGKCASITCGGDPCSAAMPCCGPTPYCTGTVASSANYCRSTAGKAGERCVITSDCISGLTCSAGRCN